MSDLGKIVFSAEAARAHHREEILDRIREEEKTRGLAPMRISPLLDWIDANMAGENAEDVVAKFFYGQE